MKERPILFSGAMVRAILDGRKTQTRRIMKNQPPADTFRMDTFHHPKGQHYFWAYKEDFSGCELHPGWEPICCPYGKPGDRLWVREAWRVGKPHDERAPRDIFPHVLARDTGVTVLYQAGGWRSLGPAGRNEPIYGDDEPMPDWAGKGRPSIHMPRALSRITLEITGVRVERLNECSEEDARAEGATCIDEITGRQVLFPNQCNAGSYRLGYRRLWNSINGAGAWDANPWVWVVEFRKV